MFIWEILKIHSRVDNSLSDIILKVNDLKKKKYGSSSVSVHSVFILHFAKYTEQTVFREFISQIIFEQMNIQAWNMDEIFVAKCFNSILYYSGFGNNFAANNN